MEGKRGEGRGGEAGARREQKSAVLGALNYVGPIQTISDRVAARKTGPPDMPGNLTVPLSL